MSCFRIKISDCFCICHYETSIFCLYYRNYLKLYIDLKMLSSTSKIPKIKIWQVKSKIPKGRLTSPSKFSHFERTTWIKKSSNSEYSIYRYKKRRVAFKILYLGWDYDGFVVQDNTDNTIEYHLFQALIKGCLIEDRSSSNYHRCGRTDQGVSSFSQVLYILLVYINSVLEEILFLLILQF